MQRFKLTPQEEAAIKNGTSVYQTPTYKMAEEKFWKKFHELKAADGSINHSIDYDATQKEVVLSFYTTNTASNASSTANATSNANTTTTNNNKTTEQPRPKESLFREELFGDLASLAASTLGKTVVVIAKNTKNPVAQGLGGLVDALMQHQQGSNKTADKSNNGAATESTESPIEVFFTFLEGKGNPMIDFLKKMEELEKNEKQ